MVTGEAIYKAKARIEKYGVKAFVDMLGEKAIEARGGRARLLKYYAAKYPEAPLRIVPKRLDISQHMKSYWYDVKLVSEARGITDKQARKILKREKEGDRRVRVRVIKKGKKWQLVVKGEYRHIKTNEIAQEEGTSYTHDTRDEYDEAFDECIKSALNKLGGAIFGDGYADIEDSDWVLVKVLKETWIRYYGRYE